MRLYCFTVQPQVDVKIEAISDLAQKILQFGQARLPESFRICTKEDGAVLAFRTIPFDVQGWHYNRVFRIPAEEFGMVKVIVRQRCADDILLPQTLLILTMVRLCSLPVDENLIGRILDMQSPGLPGPDAALN